MRWLVSGEPIADRRFVDDHLRSRGVLLKLLPERADRDTKIFRLILLRRTPRGAKEMGVREDATRMFCEFGEDREFLGSQMNCTSSSYHTPLHKVDRHSP